MIEGAEGAGFADGGDDRGQDGWGHGPQRRLGQFGRWRNGEDAVFRREHAFGHQPQLPQETLSSRRIGRGEASAGTVGLRPCVVAQRTGMQVLEALQVGRRLVGRDPEPRHKIEAIDPPLPSEPTRDKVETPLDAPAGRGGMGRLRRLIGGQGWARKSGA